MVTNPTLFSCFLPLPKEAIQYATQLFANPPKELLGDDDMLCFDHRAKKDGYWFFSKGISEPGQLADFIHHLIVKFDLPPFGFDWSYTCTKPRIDEFGGGAVWITKKGFEWMSTNCWLHEKKDRQ